MFVPSISATELHLQYAKL